MASPTRSLWRSGIVTGALLLVLFAVGLASGYVYSHEPARDTLDVVVTSSSSSSGARTVSGTVAGLEAGKLTLTTAGGQLTVTIPPGVALDELVRAPDGLANGARVNVGVQSTQYGLVLTGLVAVEAAP